MSIADKLLQVNQVKQDIKTAIETKGIPMTNVAFTEYANKILEISGGGGDSSQLLYDIDTTLVAPSQNMAGIPVDLYTGSTDLTKLYNDCVAGDYEVGHVFIINDVALKYLGDIGSNEELPIPTFQFGGFSGEELMNKSFLVADLTPMDVGLGIILAKIAGIPVENNNIVIKKGFEFLSFPIVFPTNLKYISDEVFKDWTSYNQPLVLPNSVQSIGERAFAYWTSNNQPLVIPNSVQSIGAGAFRDWTSNNYPLIIPNSVQSIGEMAFNSWEQVPYIIMESETPPTLEYINAFYNQNNAPIYVPQGSVDTYKNATNWSALASRIFPINKE